MTNETETGIKSINTALQGVFTATVQKMINNGVVFVVPAFYPQRAGIAKEIIAMGGEVIVAGGTPGQTLFEGSYQVSPYETTGVSETADKIADIVNAIPDEKINGKKVALFVEAAVGTLWSDNLKKKGAQIVLSNEQNLRAFFEEKSNLEAILKTAGLEAHFIPSTVVMQETLSEADIEQLYHDYKSPKGKVVLQSCGKENVESGGGKGTCIAQSFDEFCSMIAQYQGHVKVATFIEGLCSNMSMFVGNTIADKKNGGVIKGALTQQDDPFDAATLDALLARGESLGIADDKIIVLPARATLKVLGDKNLTASESNGVGNSLGYSFPEGINAQVWEIAQKLGQLMAKCGKVGLCGADLIMDETGNIWINEVNDRQQGPTEQLSLDAECAGLPGIYRLAAVSNYADCSHPKAQQTLYRLQKSAQNIYEASLNTNGTFYIKMMGKETQKAQITLNSGTYTVQQDASGNWAWNLGAPNKTTQPSNVDLKTGRLHLTLQCGIPEGQEVPSGAQILRIIGKATNGSSPFIIAGSKGVLNPEWVPIVNALRSQIFTPATMLQQGKLAQKVMSPTYQRGE